MSIIPAILPYTSEDYFSCLNAVDHVAPCVHLDIADGRFTNTKLWGDPDTVQDATAINIELHLMVQDALLGVKTWGEIPQVKLINVHIESDNVGRAIKQLHNWKKEIRIALNPGTGITSIIPSLEHVDGVLFMAVHPGKQGSPFEESVLEKIQNFHAEFPSVPIAVDGHVDETTLPKLLAAGATEFCVGSAIFNSKRPAEERFKELEQYLISLTKT